MAINPITTQFIEYFDTYYAGESIEDYRDEIGDYVCKYAESQEEVNEVLDEIDDHYEER